MNNPEITRKGIIYVPGNWNFIVSRELQTWFVMDEGREELLPGRARLEREEGGERKRSFEEKEQGSGLITETGGDSKDKVWAGEYIDFVHR